MKAYTVAHPKPSAWSNTGLANFIFDNYDPKQADGEVTNALFWELIIHGVFAFREISGWDDDEKQLWWVDLLEDSDLTPRGRALLHKIKNLAAR